MSSEVEYCDFTCINKVEKIVHISLPFSYAGNPTTGVFDVLESWKCQYITLLEGIVVGYDNVSFVDFMGRILDDQPYVHYDVKAVFQVFRPTQGSILKATVNRISKQHIGCVVHGNINVSIFLADGITRSLSQFVTLENEILLQVSYVDVQRKVIRISGKVTPQCEKLMGKHFPRQKSSHKFFSDDANENTMDETEHIEPTIRKNLAVNENLSNRIISFLNPVESTNGIANKEGNESESGNSFQQSGCDSSNDDDDRSSQCSTICNTEILSHDNSVSIEEDEKDIVTLPQVKREFVLIENNSTDYEVEHKSKKMKSKHSKERMKSKDEKKKSKLEEDKINLAENDNLPNPTISFLNMTGTENSNAICIKEENKSDTDNSNQQSDGDLSSDDESSQCSTMSDAELLDNNNFVLKEESEDEVISSLSQEKKPLEPSKCSTETKVKNKHKKKMKTSKDLKDKSKSKDKKKKSKSKDKKKKSKSKDKKKKSKSKDKTKKRKSKDKEMKCKLKTEH